MKMKFVLFAVLLIAAIGLSGCIGQQKLTPTGNEIGGGKTILVSNFDVAKVGSSENMAPGWYIFGKQRITKYSDGEMNVVGRMMSVQVVTGDKQFVLSLAPLGDSLSFMNARTEYTLEPFTTYSVTLKYNTPESGKYTFLLLTKPVAYGIDGFEFVIGEKPTRYS